MSVESALVSEETTVARRGRSPGRRVSSHQRKAVLGFLAPFGVLFALFYLVPIGYAMYRSFFVTRREGAFGAATEAFGGLENYTRVFSDNDFLRSVGRVLLFGIVQVPVMLIFALLLALLLDSATVRLKKFFRLGFFAPYAVPSVIAAIMWGFLYAPGLSPIVGFFENLRLSPDFLAGGTVLWSIANIVTWTYTGYNMLIIYAALQAIDADIYEAARMDGAGGWKIATKIKIPIVRPAIILTAVFSIIGTLQLFTEPQVLRSITTSITSTYTPNLAAYTQASANNYNYAAAMSVVLALTTAILSFTFLKLTSRGAEQ